MAALGRLLGVAAGALAAVRRRPWDYHAVSAAAAILGGPGVETLTHAELPVSPRSGQKVLSALQSSASGDPSGHADKRAAAKAALSDTLSAARFVSKQSN